MPQRSWSQENDRSGRFAVASCRFDRWKSSQMLAADDRRGSSRGSPLSHALFRAGPQLSAPAAALCLRSEDCHSSRAAAFHADGRDRTAERCRDAARLTKRCSREVSDRRGLVLMVLSWVLFLGPNDSPWSRSAL